MEFCHDYQIEERKKRKERKLPFTNDIWQNGVKPDQLNQTQLTNDPPNNNKKSKEKELNHHECR